MIRYLQTHLSRVFFLLVLFSAISCSSYGQVKFSAVCPDKKIGKNDYLQVQFKIENASNVESIDPPSFKNFSVVSGPNQESGMSDINGNVSRYVSISYFLKPQSTGNFTIGPATAKADGKQFQSEPIDILVTNASNPNSSQRNNGGGTSLSPFPNLRFDFPTEPTVQQFDDYILKKGDNINEKVQKNLFIKLDVSKTSCFVGEPIIASYKLYTRLRSESTITDAPSFNGFSVSDLQLNDNNSSSVEKYNGRGYNVYTLRKVQLYPLQPGTVTLDPVVADNKVTFLKAEYAGSQKGDMFFDMMQNFADATSPEDAVVQQHVILKSKPVEITVKPLPEENKPTDFKGAVGSFTINSSVQKNNITTDDAGNLKVVIGGIGNIQLINAPKINWPDGIDGYDAKVNDEIDKFSIPMKGNKTFVFPFTVSKAGSYTIPTFSFSFFDPASQTYKTLQTQPLIVSVTKGKGHSHGASFFKNLTTKSDDEVNIFREYAAYFIGGILLIVGIIFLALKRNGPNRKELTDTTPRTNPQKKESESKGAPGKIEKPEPEFLIPANPLQDAHDKLIEENNAGFYSVLHSSLKKYLAFKLKVPAEELSKKRMNEELDKYNVGLGTSLRLSSLIDEVELNLYAPPSNVNHMTEVYEKASEVVALLDKQVI